jgi:hypothetical protein
MLTVLWWTLMFLWGATAFVLLLVAGLLWLAVWAELKNY